MHANEPGLVGIGSRLPNYIGCLRQQLLLLISKLMCVNIVLLN